MSKRLRNDLCDLAEKGRRHDKAVELLRSIYHQFFEKDDDEKRSISHGEGREGGG